MHQQTGLRSTKAHFKEMYPNDTVMQIIANWIKTDMPRAGEDVRG